MVPYLLFTCLYLETILGKNILKYGQESDWYSVTIQPTLYLANWKCSQFFFESTFCGKCAWVFLACRRVLALFLLKVATWTTLRVAPGCSSNGQSHSQSVVDVAGSWGTSTLPAPAAPFPPRLTTVWSKEMDIKQNQFWYERLHPINLCSISRICSLFTCDMGRKNNFLNIKKFILK